MLIQAGITLGIVAVVMAFLIGLLGDFPLSNSTLDSLQYPNQIEDSQTLDENEAEDMGDLMLLTYTDIINDLASFQDNPSLERADARKMAFVGLAENFVGRYQDFSHTMRGELEELTSQAEEISEE